MAHRAEHCETGTETGATKNNYFYWLNDWHRGFYWIPILAFWFVKISGNSNWCLV